MYDGGNGRLGPKLARSALPLQSDERLVELVRAGSQDAFEQLVQRYTTRLQRRSARLVGDDRAQDVVQHTFVAAYKFLGESDAPVKISAWLFRTAHNRAIDIVRQKGTHYDELGEEAVGHAAGAAEQLEDSERTRALVNAIHDLPEKQRDAVVLSVFEGRTFEEVAELMDGTVSGVNQLMRRARRRLRSGLGALVPFAFLRSLLGDSGRRVSEIRIAELTLGGAAGGGGAMKGLALLAAGVVAAAGGTALVESQRGSDSGKPVEQLAASNPSNRASEPEARSVRNERSEKRTPTGSRILQGEAKDLQRDKQGGDVAPQERSSRDDGGRGEGDPSPAKSNEPAQASAPPAAAARVASSASIQQSRVFVSETDPAPAAYTVEQSAPGGTVTVSDQINTIAAVAPCSNRAGDPHVVECPGESNGQAIREVLVDAGEGDDSLDLSGLRSGTKALAYMRAGNDQVIGSPAPDALFGGMGADRLSGEAGDDVLVGSDGETETDAVDGADVIEGGDGDDATIWGAGGNDILRGGPGADGITGGDGNDLLEGGAAEDLLFGDAGRDHLVLRDGTQDAAALCGDGDDVVVADGFDPVGAIEDDCESSD